MSPSKSTRQQRVKVPQVPCLYRHSLNHGYYGIKKQSGKRKEHSLRTTDRKLAERRLKEWLANLGKVDAGGMGPVIAREAQQKIFQLSGVTDADVQVVRDPSWSPDKISEEGRKKLGM